MLGRGGAILALRVLQAAAGAAAGWLVARWLGPAGQGRFSLLVLLATAGAALFNGGVGLAAVPSLRRGELPAGRVWHAQLLWTAGAFLAAVPLAALLLPRWPDLGPLVVRYGLPSLLIPLVLALSGMLLADVMAYDLVALGRVLHPTAVNAGRALLWCGAVLALSRRAASLPALLDAYGLLLLAGAVMMVALVAGIARRSPEPAAVGSGTGAPGAPAGFPTAMSLAGRLWRRGRVGQLSAVVSLLHLRLDLAVVALFHPPAVVGIYSVAVLVGELLWLIPGALQPVLVHAAAGTDPRRDMQTIRAVRLAVIASALAAFSMLMLAPWLLPRLFGTAYAGAVPALRALLPGIVVFAVGAVLAGDFIGRGRPAWNTAAGGVTLAVNLAAGFLLIPRHGAVGAAWASSLAYATGTAVMLHRFHGATGLPWRVHFRSLPVS